MQKNFEVPEQLLADKDGYLWLVSLWEFLSTAVGDEVCVQFNRCKLIDANLSSVMGAFFDEWSDKGVSVFLTEPLNRTVRKVLSRNGFLACFNIKNKIEEKENYIKYRCFDGSESEAFKIYLLEELLMKQQFPKCSIKAKEKIVESIYEVFANAVTHSGKQSVYTCGEANLHNDVHTLDMTIANLGRTISENVNGYLKKQRKAELSQEDTIKWAFEKGNTTKSIPGGLGLDILKEFIDLNHGNIQMVSGGAMLSYANQTFTTDSLGVNFPGTIVTLNFNCDDQKAYSLTEEVVDLQDLL